MKQHWTLDPDITFLNHGSFGATPRVVLERQQELRERMEREPVLFLARQLEGLLDEVRGELAAFLGADPAGLAFVPNATSGVNAVLRSLDLDQHDELLVTNQEYNACRNVLDYVAAISGARVVVADVPFPLTSPDDVIGPILARVTSRTRILLIDHVTSQTATVFPVERLAGELRERGIDTLIDGAHAPGMIPLDLRALGAAWYTGNLHKWVCAPKGAAFLYAGETRRSIRPAIISHGANSTRNDRSRYLIEFDWVGTLDPTPWLSVPAALRFFSALEGGWSRVMHDNRALALRARDILIDRLGTPKPVPDEMLGSMAAVPLPDGDAQTAPSLYGDVLQDQLFDRHRIEVPVVPWPHPPKRVLRVSAQLYNEEAEYVRLAEAVKELLGQGVSS